MDLAGAKNAEKRKAIYARGLEGLQGKHFFVNFLAGEVAREIPEVIIREGDSPINFKIRRGDGGKML